MSALRTWWQGLADRERVLVAVGSAVVLACLYFLLVLDPLDQRVDRLEKSLKAELETRAWLESQRASISPTARTAPVADDGRSPLARINDAAAAHQVAVGLKRITPVSEQRYTLGFEDVSYRGFMQWLVEMVEERGAMVERIRMERREAAGIVTVEVSLQFP